MQKRRNAKKSKTKTRQKKVIEEVMELDRNLLRKLQDDPLGSSDAAMDEVMEIYALERLAKR